MSLKKGVRIIVIGLPLVAGVVFYVLLQLIEGNYVVRSDFVALPEIVNATVAPRVVYVENPRFPKVATNDLFETIRIAAALVQEHFGITVVIPEQIPVIGIDNVFTGLVKKKPANFDRLIGDFKHGKVDWERVRASLVTQINMQEDPLAKQVEFARPHLIEPLTGEDLDSFSQAVIETFKARLSYWTRAKLADGYPVIGKTPGRPELPLNEYSYWSLMAKLGIEAEIVLTNQLVVSVEYLPTPLHTSIRGGITGGSTDYNPSSRLGSSVWVSLFPYFSTDPLIRELRNGESYTRDEALAYAGGLLAHELGHQLLQLDHPWANSACMMRPAEVLDFTAWFSRLDAKKCQVGSSPAMEPGAVKISIW